MIANNITEKIIKNIDQLVDELTKSSDSLKGVGYIVKLPELVKMREEYSSNPSKESMEKIYYWILGGNAWTENAILPDNMFLIWSIMSVLRKMYEINYVEYETEKGKTQILNHIMDMEKIRSKDIEIEWGPERIDDGTIPLAIKHQKKRKTIYISRENINDYVEDKNVKGEINKMVENNIESLLKG